MKPVYYYNVSDHEFMNKMHQIAKAINSHGGGAIYLNDHEYAQAKRIAKTANVFKKKWFFKLYFLGIPVYKESGIDNIQGS